MESGRIAAQAEAIVGSYQRIKLSIQVRGQQMARKEQEKWTPPVNGWFKKNMDATTKINEQLS